MKKVFLLQHSYERDGYVEIKVIGIYSSREIADEAIYKIGKLPGFIDHGNCFFVDEYELDKDHWIEGFFTTD